MSPDGLRVKPEGATNPGYPAFGPPILLQTSDYLLIPFWMQFRNEQSKFEFSGSGSQFSGGGTSVSIAPAFGGYLTYGTIRWNNLVIHDKKNVHSHLLLDHKALISKIYLPSSFVNGSDAKPDSGTKYLLLGIQEQDTNGDGYINDEDAEVLYAVDVANPTPIRLTPAGTQLHEIIADGPDTLYIRVLRDSDGDRKFTIADESVILRVDLRHPAEGQPVLDEQLRKRARSIIEAK